MSPEDQFSLLFFRLKFPWNLVLLEKLHMLLDSIYEKNQATIWIADQMVGSIW